MVWQVWLWGLAAVEAMMLLAWVGSVVRRDHPHGLRGIHVL